MRLKWAIWTGRGSQGPGRPPIAAFLAEVQGARDVSHGCSTDWQLPSRMWIGADAETLRV